MSDNPSNVARRSASDKKNLTSRSSSDSPAAPTSNDLQQTSCDGFEQTLSRYVVGIDLGTTNCAVAYIDTTQASASAAIENFSIEQWVDLGGSARRELLPSFLYQPQAEELTSLSLGNATSPQRIAGVLARERGMQLPGRQIASSKSWLCHDGVDRRAPILPWQNEDDVEKISPVSASAELLAHMVRVWDRAHPSQPLSQQDIVITLPASFDQVARQLTIEAAAQAGLKRILPIEEPQAACYAWLARHAVNWEKQLAPGQTILVCDIGGGTTDFTLIRVRDASTNSDDGETLAAEHRVKLSLHRVAVGQHLILGGDNFDLALARLAEQKLAAQNGGGSSALSSRSWDALRQVCRAAKESLLGAEPPESSTLHLPGSGSRLIASGRQVELCRDEVNLCVVDGFFPKCALGDRPDNQQTGFQEFGLPFARDPAITKHLAAFLWAHRWDGRDEPNAADSSADSTATSQTSPTEIAAARPDWLLFNGGVMTSPQLRERLVSTIATWFAGVSDVAAGWRPGVLDAERLDLAVARGAAYFGQVRRGHGVEIEAKLACSFYMQTSTQPPRAICIVPGSASPGDKFQLTDQAMELAIGQPVQFPILYSSTRLSDRVGQSVAIEAEHFVFLPSIRTVIERGANRRQATLPVYVETELTQIGTLQMYCHAAGSTERWKLEFDVRGSTQTDHHPLEASANQAGIVDEELISAADRVLAQAFGQQTTIKPAKLKTALAEALAQRSSDWTPHLLRGMWSSLIELQEGRRISPAHEARWLNLLGYTLRPGYGLAADDWRVAQTWRSVHGKLCFAAASSRNEALVLWRRIAGGFTAGQQLTVYQQVAGPLRGVLDPQRRSKGGISLSPQELVELLRLVGSLELLPKGEKSQLGQWLLELLPVKKWSACQGAMLWTLGRLGNRTPAYGPLNCVVESERVERWLSVLIGLRSTAPELKLALMLCGRRVDDRYRDVSESIRQSVVARLESMPNPSAHAIALVRNGGRLASEEATQLLGEALPLGLTLRD
ncbi:MAG: Hsp70 family protein [Planctomycetales bacterium]|nr:Hsp70 family protein [Planctomycetales bacterium]